MRAKGDRPCARVGFAPGCETPGQPLPRLYSEVMVTIMHEAAWHEDDLMHTCNYMSVKLVSPVTPYLLVGRRGACRPPSLSYLLITPRRSVASSGGGGSDLSSH